MNQKRKEDLRGSTCIPYVKGVSEKIKSILTKAGVRVALKPVCTLAKLIYSVYQKQDHQRREPKPLYTNLNVEHARSLMLANPNGVGVRDGWNISLVFGETTIRQSKNMLKRLDMVQQNQMQ